jgi:hypothetical protein
VWRSKDREEPNVPHSLSCQMEEIHLLHLASLSQQQMTTILMRNTAQGLLEMCKNLSAVTPQCTKRHWRHSSWPGKAFQNVNLTSANTIQPNKYSRLPLSNVESSKANDHIFC